MKRQRSRNRGNGGGNGGKPQQNANRAFESNGPDGVKIRGAAQHVFEKYQQLARDALTAGDRVLGESYQQHAEHYFRVLRAVQPGRAASDIMGRDAFASGFDIDFEDESGADADTQTEAQESDNAGSESRDWRQEGRRDERQQRDRNYNRDDRPRDDRPRDDNRPRDDRPRDDNRPREDRSYNRDDRPQGDRSQGDRSQGDRPQGDRPQRDRNFNRDDRPRDENRPREDRTYNRDDRPQGDRNDRPAREDRGPREDRPPREDRQRHERSDPLAVVEPRATPLTADAEAGASPVLRSHDGGVSHAPAFLQSAPPTASKAEPASGEEAAPKPKRRPRAKPATVDEG